MTRGRPRHDDILTPREWDVLALLREGLTNQQIAARLDISANTAKYHVAEILAKLEVATREEAAAWEPETTPRSRFTALASLAWLMRHLPSGLAGKAVATAAAIGVVGVFAFALSVLAQQGDVNSLGKIAYVQDGNLWVKTLPDGKPQQLTTDGDNAFPKWSSSGEWLSFTHGTYPDSKGWVMRAEGSSRHRVEAAGYALEQWSPTEDELLYVRPDSTWWTESADGTGPRVIATPYSSPTEAGQTSLMRTGDGSFLYTEVRWPADIEIPGDLASPPPEKWSSYSLGRMDEDGRTREKALRFAPPTEQIIPLAPPPGEALLFATAPLEGGSPMLDGLPLHAVSMSGGAVLHLDATVVLGSGVAARPRSSDEFAVVVGGGRESWTNKQIAVINANTGATTRLTPEGVAANSPAWSPNGSQLAYVGSIDAGPDGRDASLASRRIWAMNADGSNSRQLTRTDGEYRDEAPIWSSDGAHILFFRLSLDTCNPSYRVMLLDIRDGSVEEVLSGLSPIARVNYGFEAGEVPECGNDGTDPGVTDFLGRLNFGPVFAWWQPHETSRAPTAGPQVDHQ